MSATGEPLSDITTKESKLGCYSRLFSTRARVLEPANTDELAQIFAHARETKGRVTLRAGGHSFDAQALGDDLVVSMMRFDAIELLAGQRKVKVGAGATWGAILATLQPLGLVPAVTVTTEHATAGGTLSGDCLSRFSPAWGKEGMHVLEFDLLTTAGELLTCTPPGEGVAQADWTPAERAFSAVIGGLGYVGAVVSITYKVLSVGQTDGRIGVLTKVRKFETIEQLAEHLVPATELTYGEESDPRDPEKFDAIYSALLTGGGRRDVLYFTSAFTTTTKRRRMALHRPRMALRVLIEWLLRVPLLSKLIWRIAFRFLYRDGKVYIDDIEGFTFFMDGNARAKRIAERLGFPMRNVQQTFVVPSDPRTEGGWDRAKDDLVEWLEHAHKFFRERKLEPTLHDVLFLPPDKRFHLSASAEMAGFAVSYAFETSNKKRIGKVKEAFSELADVLGERFGGRVYLVKNVFAKKERLVEMYGDNAVAFFNLKAEFDPDGILRNDFLERTFGDLLEDEISPAGALEQE